MGASRCRSNPAYHSGLCSNNNVAVTMSPCQRQPGSPAHLIEYQQCSHLHQMVLALSSGKHSAPVSCKFRCNNRPSIILLFWLHSRYLQGNKFRCIAWQQTRYFQAQPEASMCQADMPMIRCTQSLSLLYTKPFTVAHYSQSPTLTSKLHQLLSFMTSTRDTSPCTMRSGTCM